MRRRYSSPAFSPVPTAVAPMFSSSRSLGRVHHVAVPAADALGVAAELLAERDRHGVLQVGAAGLQHVGELVGLVREADDERLRGGGQRRVPEQQRQPRGRRVDVVRRLPHVDVIVRVHAPVGAFRLAEDLAGAVRQHLVRVHVVRRAGAGLVHVDDELIAERAGQDLVGRRDDRVGDVAIEASERGVGFGGGFLDEDGRDDQIVGRAKAADREVLDGARGLHAVVRVGGHVELAERIALASKARSHQRRPAPSS